MPWIVCGGFSLAPKNIMLEHCKLFNAEYERVVKLGYSPTDEMITGWIINLHPELYEFVCGDYASIFSNFAGNVRANHERLNAIMQQIQQYEGTKIENN